jgi:hypothetical protein
MCRALCCCYVAFLPVDDCAWQAFPLNLHTDSREENLANTIHLHAGDVSQLALTAFRGVSAGALFVRECTGLQCGFMHFFLLLLRPPTMLLPLT